ncbi:MAG: methyltransferase domain-containing protein [Gomphosphaeria aponina SAG 52.96 = DSM 107014]|uniref:Methyltransferase domain-containing protein n=1 Tax=Gomphosphaeria aponina SAG 52.96 = DSM 107014 TaxID=1521640 RepID=A0A941GYF0_9CHRO|nr:methyltransferase domain-containing protein [Gomphosphaeria aponina SAG 52.96 = DSM 107014]
MERILEPEVMDTEAEAVDYDAMDFTEVNTAFAEKAIEIAPKVAKILDAGTGTARIPIIICQKRPHWKIIAIDMAKSMLERGKKNIELAGLTSQIQLELIDAKQMPYPPEQFNLVISNSLVHHLPNPLPFFQEVKRVLQPNGAILIRDLMRPPSQKIINNMVEEIGGDYNQHQKDLFRDSLQAALTLNEVQDLVAIAGLTAVKIYQSSDRHWTIERAFIHLLLR